MHALERDTVRTGTGAPTKLHRSPQHHSPSPSGRAFQPRRVAWTRSPLSLPFLIQPSIGSSFLPFCCLSRQGFTVQPRLASDSRQSCLGLTRDGIRGTCLHTCPGRPFSYALPLFLLCPPRKQMSPMRHTGFQTHLDIKEAQAELHRGRPGPL